MQGSNPDLRRLSPTIDEEHPPDRPAEVLPSRPTTPDQQEEMVAEQGTLPPPTVTFREVLWGFLKTLTMNITTDLHTITCPAIMLNGISLLEYAIHWAEYPEILTRIVEEQTSPGERMLNVVKWFISSLHGAYAARSKAAGFERKPYNPILGEQFHAVWKAADTNSGDTELQAEQVSHHPPVSAFYLVNRQAGIYVNGFGGQRTALTAGTAIRVTQVGRVYLWLDKFQEEYMVSLPEIHLRGLLVGSPFIELTGETVIVSSSGWGARLKFNPKPWFSGEYDTMEGIIADISGQQNKGNSKQSTTSNPPSLRHAIWGKWSSQVMVRMAVNDKSVSSNPKVLFDIKEMRRNILPQVKPLPQQSPIESRRVWHKVTQALASRNYELADQEKSKIENEQRALRKSRAESGEEWKPALFVWNNTSNFFTMPNESNTSTITTTSSNSYPNNTTEAERTTTSTTSSGTVSEESFNDHSSATGSSSGSSTESSYSSTNNDLEQKGRWIHKDFYEQFIKLKQVE